MTNKNNGKRFDSKNSPCDYLEEEFGSISGWPNPDNKNLFIFGHQKFFGPQHVTNGNDEGYNFCGYFSDESDTIAMSFENESCTVGR